MAKPMRKLGFYTQYLAKENNVSDEEMCEIIGCNNNELHRFYCGRLFLHLDSIKAVAARLNISVKQQSHSQCGRVYKYRESRKDSRSDR